MAERLAGKELQEPPPEEEGGAAQEAAQKKPEAEELAAAASAAAEEGEDCADGEKQPWHLKPLASTSDYWLKKPWEKCPRAPVQSIPRRKGSLVLRKQTSRRRLRKS